MSEVTRLFEHAQQCDGNAAEKLLPLVYAELRRIAASQMSHEPAGQTLQPTALVHEAYLRLASQPNLQWKDERHFLNIAAEAMRRILVENARRKKSAKHGGQLERMDIEQADIVAPMPDEDLLAVDEALNRLGEFNARAAEVVKLCFFVGLSQEQAARQIGVSTSTAERLWRFARAWLFREIGKNRGEPR